MTYTALIPVKSLTTAKSRLAPYLSPNERETLVLDMLHHVLRTLLDSQSLERVSVVSPDMCVLAQAQAWGAQPLIEEVHGHNPALHAAALREQATSTTTLLTVFADLPLLCISDIHAMIEQSKQYQVVLAPSQDDTGTNAILVRPPLALPYLFGPGSLQRYIQAAEQRNLSVTLYKSIGLALDIDTIDDLHTLHCLTEATISSNGKGRALTGRCIARLPGNATLVSSRGAPLRSPAGRRWDPLAEGGELRALRSPVVGY